MRGDQNRGERCRLKSFELWGARCSQNTQLNVQVPFFWLVLRQIDQDVPRNLEDQARSFCVNSLCSLILLRRVATIVSGIPPMNAPVCGRQARFPVRRRNGEWGADMQPCWWLHVHAMLCSVHSLRLPWAHGLACGMPPSINYAHFSFPKIKDVASPLVRLVGAADPGRLCVTQHTARWAKKKEQNVAGIERYINRVLPCVSSLKRKEELTWRFLQL